MVGDELTAARRLRPRSRRLRPHRYATIPRNHQGASAPRWK